MSENDKITLEVCSNTEWLTASLDLSNIVHLENEAGDALNQQLWDGLAAVGYQCEGPGGQRCLYHGWNGCNTFKHNFGPVGTFDDLTEAQVNEIYDIIEKAQKTVVAEYSRLSAEMYSECECPQCSS